MEILSGLIGVNIVAVVFGAGALWQKVRDVDRRVERIENALNGYLKTIH